MAAEARANGERWFASAALTGGRTGPGTDSSQCGAVARLAGVPLLAEEGFDSRAGHWGTMEVGARFSTLDLNDRHVRGGRQRVWSLGLGWWPVERLSLFAQYQHVDVAGRESGNRRFQTLALRALVNY